MDNKPEPRFKKGDLVYRFDHNKNEVVDDTVVSNDWVSEESYVYGLFKCKRFIAEEYLFKTPLECLTAQYINAQEKMIGAELELKAAQRNVEFFYNLCKEESERLKREQET